MNTLILASTSRYRAKALQQLGIPFDVVAPHTDETPHPNEPADALAGRLALEKALSVAEAHPNQVIIGSDQTGACEGRLLGKPGTTKACIEQLSWLSGKAATFYTAVATHSPGGAARSATIATQLKFRILSRTQIENYVARDQPLDCAGGFKIESLGIALFESVRADDPSALVGLPLLALIEQLNQAGIEVLDSSR